MSECGGGLFMASSHHHHTTTVTRPPLAKLIWPPPPPLYGGHNIKKKESQWVKPKNVLMNISLIRVGQEEDDHEAFTHFLLHRTEHLPFYDASGSTTNQQQDRPSFTWNGTSNQSGGEEVEEEFPLELKIQSRFPLPSFITCHQEEVDLPAEDSCINILGRKWNRFGITGTLFRAEN